MLWQLCLWDTSLQPTPELQPHQCSFLSFLSYFAFSLILSFPLHFVGLSCRMWQSMKFIKNVRPPSPYRTAVQPSINLIIEAPSSSQSINMLPLIVHLWLLALFLSFLLSGVLVAQPLPFWRTQSQSCRTTRFVPFFSARGFQFCTEASTIRLGCDLRDETYTDGANVSMRD